jgi:hypothetical protein
MDTLTSFTKPQPRGRHRERRQGVTIDWRMHAQSGIPVTLSRSIVSGALGRIIHMAAKTPTWVWVVFGIVGVVVVLCVAVIGGGIFMFRSHVHSNAVPKQAAQQEFDRQRNRFAGQQPLVQVGEAGELDSKIVVHRPSATAPRHTDLQGIRVLTYDERNGQLVNIDVPLWFARWALKDRGDYGHGRVSFGGRSVEFESGDLTFEDIERHGPGLIIDATDTRGAQVLVWAE